MSWTRLPSPTDGMVGGSTAWSPLRRLGGSTLESCAQLAALPFDIALQPYGPVSTFRLCVRDCWR